MVGGNKIYSEGPLPGVITSSEGPLPGPPLEGLFFIHIFFSKKNADIVITFSCFSD
jgi:hypothetical protein